VLLLAGCSAAQVSTAPDASRIRIGTQPPGGSHEQLGAITAKHGGGCGLYGTRGDYEGAYTILRNKAAQIGADYVQVVRVIEPHMEGICMNQAYVIDGLAYRLSAQPAVAAIATPPAAPAPTPSRRRSRCHAGDVERRSPVAVAGEGRQCLTVTGWTSPRRRMRRPAERGC
jgi:hypothetical protein